MNERYEIYCTECETSRYLILDTQSDGFLCPECNTMYFDEDGVMDTLEIADFYAQYKGAKRAGLIREPDYDGLSEMDCLD